MPGSAATPDRLDKGYRADASQFFVAGELCRRGLVAVVTLGNCPNTDILCSDRAGKNFVHIQVKTFVPGHKTVSVGRKAEINYGANFIWVLSGIPEPESRKPFCYYVIPSADIARNVSESHRMWLSDPGKKGQARNDNSVRTVSLPPLCSYNGWDIKPYENRWNIIEDLLHRH